MKYRKLRIAWSVAWGVVAVLLCVLWVRSYWYQDRLRCAWLEGSSVTGLLALEVGDPGLPWGITSDEVRHPGWYKPVLGWSVNAKTTAVFASHTTLAVLTALIAPLAWLPWHFSLRTLLIATTLVAVVLGLIVWSVRG